MSKQSIVGSISCIFMRGNADPIFFAGKYQDGLVKQLLAYMQAHEAFRGAFKYERELYATAIQQAKLEYGRRMVASINELAQLTSAKKKDIIGTLRILQKHELIEFNDEDVDGAFLNYTHTKSITPLLLEFYSQEELTKAIVNMDFSALELK
jgi:hypothetical protein